MTIVEKIQPEVFIIENVKALLSTSVGWFKNQILDKIQQLRYFVDYGVLTASDFGPLKIAIFRGSLNPIFFTPVT